MLLQEVVDTEKITSKTYLARYMDTKEEEYAPNAGKFDEDG